VIDDALVLRVERLRDEVEQLRSDLKARYKTAERPVVAPDVRDAAARLGERWLVEIASRDDVRQVLGEDVVGDLGIEFQRLITCSEQVTQRRRYEASVANILIDFRNRVVVPLKRARYRAVAGSTTTIAEPPRNPAPASVFIGQSFSPTDANVNSAVARLVEAYGFPVLTGEKPKADTVSKKVRERIEAASVFLGVFTRRDRIKGRQEWTTSSWVIDEKAYALAKGKKLILLRESGVQSIGGIQGDYEYVEFIRENMVEVLIRLVQVLRSLEDGAV
jgi:hypothetical protein